MKTHTATIIAGSAIALTAGWMALAQQTSGPVPHNPEHPAAPVHQAHAIPHQTIPTIAALDADRNGEISAEEIANASAALQKLDANNDGKLSRDEFLPPVPAGFKTIPHQKEPVAHRQGK